MYLIYDTETTGLPRNWKLDYTHSDNWPRVVQIAWQIHDDMGKLVEAVNYLVQPEGFNIPFDAERVHGISTELAKKEGQPLAFVLQKFREACDKVEFIVGHNVGFDNNVMSAEYYRQTPETPFLRSKSIIDTCTEQTAELCKLPGGRGGKYKVPKLIELHVFLFGNAFAEAHNATADVEATARCFLELIRIRVFSLEQLHQEGDYFDRYRQANPEAIAPIGLVHVNLKAASDALKKGEAPAATPNEPKADLEYLRQFPFAHLHNHTQFTMLNAITTIDELISISAKYDMPAVAMTDNGNMMGAFMFQKAVFAYNDKIDAQKKEAEEAGEPFTKQKITPIIGCEFNVCANHKEKSYQDNGYQIVMLAKNEKGYHNLIKMASLAFTEGKYYVPRIDKEIIKQYKGDYFVLSGNMYGEIPSLILNVGEKQAEEALLWWKEQFGDDFYLELMRHGQEDEDYVNKVLIEFSKKHNVKLVATNNTFYAEKADAETHDILLCVGNNELLKTPIGKGRGFRFGFPNKNYYLRSSDEMRALFSDVPEALTNIKGIIEQVEPYYLGRDILLPKFDIPEEFQDPKDLEDGGKRGENNYLRHLTYEGAKTRYPEMTDAVRERLDFELETIEKTGFPGYFLIVQDFIAASRDMGVSVGPGRGSAAGSAVAYCIGITSVDPIKYDLLFERFLNPERISMPDIDTDFDDAGRGKVMQYCIDKYGANQVAQIMTYGKMAAKSAIRDTARVLDIPLSDADRIAKLVPTIPNITLNNLFHWDDEKLKEKLKGKAEDLQAVAALKQIRDSGGQDGELISQALKLEGSMRNTGIHACGVIIAPDDVTNYVPVALTKDETMYCTQFDNSVAEESGLLKMDFLGLKTLTLIKDTIENVKKSHGIEINPDEIPIEDEKTYELFQRGDTIGVFQYESPGMQKYLRDLKPTVFADLIAMNALYRPGPIQYIPSFIKRKNGEEEITYDLPAMEEYLKETYGITVYQEQVMLLSQKLANFTKGEADTLRKAMGKKKIKVLAKMKPKFIDQAHDLNGHPKDKLEKIWHDWEAFASYAFNKSHSTCYAWVAYQTAYLKANYPAEYMASVLSNNMNDIKEVTLFMEECAHIGLEVLGPDVNESDYNFTVNKKGAIRFGLGAIKGLGEGPVSAIVEARADGAFTSIFDFVKRVNLRACNKKAMESLAYAGGFDSFTEITRAQLFEPDPTGKSFIESLIRYGNSYQESQNSSQVSLFGEGSAVEMPAPTVPKVDDWGTLFKLNKEKEVIGVYISGHPLDDYKWEIKAFCNGNVSMLKEPEKHLNKEILLAGIITDSMERMSKNNSLYGKMTIEDYSDAYDLFMFSEDYQKFRPFFYKDTMVAMRGRFQKRRYGNEVEFKVTAMERLQSLRENQTQELQITLQYDALSQAQISELNETFSAYPGQCPIGFYIYDPNDHAMKIETHSRNTRVELKNDLLKHLQKMGWDIALIGKSN